MNDRTDGTSLQRRGIQSVETGVAVLLALASAEGPLMLKDIARSAGLPASNCHRYLVSFTRTGFVTQHPRTGAYDLGPALLQAGLTALGRLDRIGIATDALEQLVDETGHTGMVSIWAAQGPTIVRWLQGPQAVHTTLAPGSTLPLMTTATGQVFLAFLPGRQTAELQRDETGKQTPEIENLRRFVRQNRVATVTGDHIPGLNAAAAPVLDAAGEAAAVLTLVSAGTPFSSQTLAALRHNAASASAALGWVETAIIGATDRSAQSMR